MKLKIINDREKNWENVSEVYLIPSHYGHKKDIYAYNHVGQYLGVVSNKSDDKNGTSTRDTFNNAINTRLENNKELSVSVKASVYKIDGKKMYVEIDNIATISNISVSKSVDASVRYLEVVHMPSRTTDKIQPNKHVITIDEKELNNNDITIKNGDDNMLGMNMDKIFGGKIGMVKTDSVKLGINGEIAIKKADGTYVTFKDDTLTNVSEFAFDIGGLFILPVSVDKVKKGDIIVKDNQYYHVDEDGQVGKGLQGTTVEGKIEKFRFTKSMLFGSEFVRKVVSPFSMLSENSDFSSNPMMMLMFANGFNGFGNSDKNDLMTTMLLMNMVNDKNSDMSKMLPFMLMQQNGNNDMMTAMMLMNMNNGLFNNETKPKEKSLTEEDIKKYIEKVIESKTKTE